MAKGERAARAPLPGGEEFGARLRALRRTTGMTMQQLADRAGLAVSTISKIETSRTSPTYDVLLKLAGGLGADFSTLLEGAAPRANPGAEGRLNVTRAAERKAHPAGAYVYEPMATGLLDKLIDPTVAHVKARSREEFEALISHPGEEFVYVVSGEVELITDIYAPIRLAAGDSVYYDARMGHAFISKSREDAVILNIVAGGSPRPRSA